VNPVVEAPANADDNLESGQQEPSSRIDDSARKQMMDKEKLMIAIISIIASAGLTALKLAIGYSTNSLGILSEAMHSGLDVMAAVMTFYAVRMVMRPPDKKYTYGYAKYESLSSLLEIILLFAIAGWIFYEGFDRIFFKNVQPEVTVFSFAIMFISVGVDFGRSRALYRAAKKYGSQALEADALHFKADMLTSGIIIAGLFMVLLAKVPNADAFAAIAAAAMMIYTSLGLGRRTLDVLLDRAPKGVYSRVVEAVSGLEGLDNAHDIRIRNVGKETFVDMHIEVPRTYTHDKAHRVATSVEDRVRQALPNSSVLVHVDAVETGQETITDRVRLIAAETEGIKNVHSIFLSKIIHPSSPPSSTSPSPSPSIPSEPVTKSEGEIDYGLHLYLDVQMEGSIDIKKAHSIIDDFERRIKQEVPRIKFVTTHMETETSENTTIGVQTVADQSTVEKIIRLALSVESVVDCKDVSIININNELHVTLTIVIDAANKRTGVTSLTLPANNSTHSDKPDETQPGSRSITLNEAHRIATDVQNLILRAMHVSRVVVHIEPF